VKDCLFCGGSEETNGIESIYKVRPLHVPAGLGRRLDLDSEKRRIKDKALSAPNIFLIKVTKNQLKSIAEELLGVRPFP